MTEHNSQPREKSQIRRFIEETLWWTPPIGLLADIIAIWTYLTQVGGGGLGSSQTISGVEKSDFVFLTGLLTLVAVVGTAIFVYDKSRNGSKLWIVGGTGFIMLGIFAYLRLWLGATWWIWVLTFCGFCMLAVFMPFLNKLLPKDSTYQPKSRYSPQNRNEKRSDSEDDWSQSYKQTIEPRDFVKKPGHRDSTIMICALCNGSGRHRLVDTCPGCGGKGSVLVIVPAKLCALCGGKGSKSVLKDPPCPACGGSGWPHTI